MEINENLIRITGSAYVEEMIDPSKTLEIKGELAIYAVEKRDNNDGTFNLINKARFINAIDGEQGRKLIRGVDKSKKSIAWRITVGELADELGEDREEFYKRFMDKLIANPHNVWEYLREM